MLDLGFPAGPVKAVPILARTAGLLAHLAEEQEQPLGFLLAARRGGSRRRTSRRRMMLDAEVETRPWEEQLALDDASYREPARLPARALGLLPREARRGGILEPEDAGGSTTSRGCR